MDLTSLLAIPGSLSTKVQIGIADHVDVCPLKLDLHREELERYCTSLPVDENTSWKMLTLYTGGNGALAKLLMLLGNEIGVWEAGMLPTDIAPRFFRVRKPSRHRVLKPSAGEVHEE